MPEQTLFSSTPYGVLPDGRGVIAYTLSNRRGFSCTVINYGAAITSLLVPVSGDKKIDVVLGFDSLDGYVHSYQLPSAPYFGAVVGRYAGRIGKAQFPLNGKRIELTKNHGVHHLHGGYHGFSMAYWTLVKPPVSDEASITLRYVSEDLEENYPGEMTTDVTYTITEKNELIVSFRAWCSADSIINLTQHSYFNLDGPDGRVTNQELMIRSGQVLEKDDEQIPTGRFVSLDGHPLDYRIPKKCPDAMDHSFVLQQGKEIQATLHSPKNRLTLSVITDQPALHVYVGGNCGSQAVGKEEQVYHSQSGICFETQHFPDSPNHPHFPDTQLRKGDVYTHTTRFTFISEP